MKRTICTLLAALMFVSVLPLNSNAASYKEVYIGKNIYEASFKIDRALKAGADAMGAECKIYNLPGYLFSVESPELKGLVEGNIVELIGEEKLGKSPSGFTTEANDVSNLIPTVHAMVGGSVGIGHSSNYEIEDKQLAYVTAAKMLAMTVVDLLANGAEKALEVKANFKAPLTKESYIQLLDELKA